MAIISGLFHQEQDLERAVNLLEQSGFSNLFISSNKEIALPVPGSFLVTNLQREPNTESNFNANPGLPVPFFRPVPENASRLTLSVKREDKLLAMTLLKRTNAQQIRLH